jgi:hypothetical protein
MNALRELSEVIGRHTGPGQHARWRSDALGLMFATATRPSEPVHQVYEPVFAVVVQGEKELVLADEVFNCGKGSFVVVSVDLPIAFRV